MLGFALIAAALGVGASAFGALGRAGTPPNPGEPTTAIVAVGPYRFTPNPIYLSFTLLYAGVTVVANALWAVVLLPGVLIVMRRGVIDRENAIWSAGSARSIGATRRACGAGSSAAGESEQRWSRPDDARVVDCWSNSLSHAPRLPRSLPSTMPSRPCVGWTTRRRRAIIAP